MNNIQRYDVVIVGGGMTGLSLLLALRQQGFEVCLIESGQSGDGLLPQRVERRVSAINRRSERLFQQLGVWDAIVASRISPYFKMQVWDDVPQDGFSMSAQEAGEPNLGYIIENDVIVSALVQKAYVEGIKIHQQYMIEAISNNEYGHHIIANGQHFETRLIVGADGAESFIRDYFGLGVSEKPYDHTAMVATVELSQAHHSAAYQRFYADGILAFLPLSEPNRASIVWSVKTPIAQQLMSLDNDAFAVQLQQAMNNHFGVIKLLSPKFSFELIARHAKSYCQQGIVLVGDAAHTIHPLAGQGVNLGLKDVLALVEVLAQAKSGKRDYAQIDVLNRYERKRRLDNQLTLLAMRSFKEGFTQPAAPLQWLRKQGLRWIDRQAWSKRIFIKEALGE